MNSKAHFIANKLLVKTSKRSGHVITVNLHCIIKTPKRYYLGKGSSAKNM